MGLATKSAQDATRDQEPQQTDHRGAEAQSWPWLGASGGKLLLGCLFGIIFGFLLQKGGVAKFDILIGVLLLENFTVIKVMGTAVTVGMAGVYLLERFNLLSLQIKETVLGANVFGGLIFGVGFALLAYCPGTNAAALGQGNLDAITGVVGLVFGSYLFAVSSRAVDSTVGAWGKYGKATLASMLGVSRGAFVIVAVPVFVLGLIALEYMTP